MSASSRNVLEQFLAKVKETISEFTLPANEDKSIEAIMKQMSYPKEDVLNWWSKVRWVQDQRPELESASGMKGQDATTKTVSKSVLKLTLDDLEKAGVVKAPAGGWDFALFVSADRLVD